MGLSHIPDGAGLASPALWPSPFQPDTCRPLRKTLEQLCYKHELHKIVRSHILQHRSNQTLVAYFGFFFAGVACSFEITTDQPFRLFALATLAQLAMDPDASFITTLVDGVDLGITKAIEPSDVWPIKQNEQDVFGNDFHSFDSNITLQLTKK